MDNEIEIKLVPRKRIWSDDEETRRIDEFMKLHEISGAQSAFDNFVKMIEKLSPDKIEYTDSLLPILNTRDDKIEYLASSICYKKIYDFIVELVSKDVAHLDKIDVFRRDALNEATTILMEDDKDERK